MSCRTESACADGARLYANEPHIVPVDCFSRAASAAAEVPARAPVLETELACLREFGRLIGRDPRYRKLVSAMYLGSVIAPVRARMFRALYCFFRRLDDVLDGDLHTEVDPQRYVRRVLSSLEGGARRGWCPSVLLGSYVVQNLHRITVDEEYVRTVMSVLLRTMQFDYQRMIECRILDEATLYQHLRTVFSCSLELGLVVAGSKHRWAHFNDLIEAQIRLFTLRDLGKDLSRHLVNIPAHALGTNPGAMRPATNADRLLADRKVAVWVEKQHALGARSVAAAGRVLSSCRCRRTRLLLFPVYSDLNRICRGGGSHIPAGRA